MSTADHPQTDGQTERVNRVVEDALRSICAETPKRWSAMLPPVEFALNNAVHASTGYTPFYVNGLSHPRVPLTPPRPDSGLSGEGEFAERLADISPLAVRKQVDTFLSTRLSVLRHVRDAMAESQDKQNEHADVKGRSNVNCYEVEDLVLLNAKNMRTHAVSAVFKTKSRPRFIGPFKVVAKKGLAYTLNLPKKMRTHPVFYVGLLKTYLDPARVSFGDLGSRASPTHLEAEPSLQQEVPREQSQDLTGWRLSQASQQINLTAEHNQRSLRLLITTDRVLLIRHPVLKSGHTVIKTTKVIPQLARNLDPVQPLVKRVNVIAAAIDALVNVLDEQP
ncbi:unnamed protein product [Phytophthora fragariaefolia]|uniref:Unnamed protein product n=1 Tax=Phytophthora fragariaefolia TaxID=1490495 RepID=A0A9W6Y624_9STRA|nr:unnamed protein product [Phytophthora fragariaefolia]